MDKIERIVRQIIKEVKEKGDRAVIRYTREFDGFSLKPQSLRIPQDVLQESVKRVSKQFLSSMQKAKKNIEFFQRHTLPKSWHLKKDGLILGEKFTPLAKVGIYVPGGRFPYPSTVLMTAVPARVAGVQTIIMVTPPKNMTNDVLAAAHICGVDEVYQVGGAQAIAALAFGTRTITKVDKIVGPGNAYVTMAKKLLFGEVGIDSLAGPSEVVVLADDSVKIEYVIADLMAQAEHGSGARAFLLTNSRKLYTQVKKKIGHARNIQTKFFNNMSEMIKRVNEIAPEHVELMVKNASRMVKDIKNAGAIFVGTYSPTALGDYWAGPSHVLPTGATARFASGLSCVDFCKRSSIIECAARYLNQAAQDIIVFAERERLKYHAASILQRVEGKRTLHLRKIQK